MMRSIMALSIACSAKISAKILPKANTLPVILAYHRGDAEAREFWETAVKNPNNDGDHLDRALALMDKTDALADTVERARHYGDKAKDALGLFPAGEVQKTLIRLVDFCIARAY